MISYHHCKAIAIILWMASTGIPLSVHGQDPSFDISFNEVVINEFLYDPFPSNGLPEAEYVELYNAGSRRINLSNILLNNYPIPAYNLDPGTFIVLCDQKSSSLFSGINVVGLSKWDPLNNEGQDITLTTLSGNLISGIKYNATLPNDPVKNEGGWSIELAADVKSCFDLSDWGYSDHQMGGSPGYPNSHRSTREEKLSFNLKDYRFINPSLIQLEFNQPIGQSGLATFEVYRVQGKAIDIHVIKPTGLFNEKLFIWLSDSMDAGMVIDLKIYNLKNCHGSRTLDTLVTLGPGRSPSFNEIMITEIMADITPPVLLPETEYIEFFNAAHDIIHMEDLQLIIGNDTVNMPAKILGPRSYYTLVKENHTALFQDLANKIEIGVLPAINNEGEFLGIIKKNGELIFSVEFRKSWYRLPEKSEGGYSLEMIDVSNPCAGSSNWMASEDRRGGTPSKENSVNKNNPDLVAPVIVKAYPISSDSIIIGFNEKIHPESINEMDIQIEPYLLFNGPVFNYRNPSEILLTLLTPIDSGKIFHVTIEHLKDCVGNIISKDKNTINVYVPEPPQAGDIIINEVLFDPLPGGTDWIELFNRSERILDLYKIAILRSKDQFLTHATVNDHYILEPGAYAVITIDPKRLLRDFPHTPHEKILEIDHLPVFPDDEGDIFVCQNNQDMDSLNYNSSFHNIFLKDTEGVSLERVSPHASSHDANNWASASSLSGYGTPGLANSQTVVIQPASLLKISPLQFSPDGDGIDDLIHFDYSINDSGYMANLIIYSISGLPVAHLMQNELSGTQGRVTWDGRLPNGSIAPFGYYIAFMEIFNPVGKKIIAKEKFVLTRKF